MKAFAWILMFIALAALAMTWVVGKEHVRSTIAAEQRALEDRSAVLKVERERLAAQLTKQQQTYLELEGQLDDLQTQIAEADALIASAETPTGDGLTAAQAEERTDLIMRIAAQRQAIETLRNELEQLRRTEK